MNNNIKRDKDHPPFQRFEANTKDIRLKRDSIFLFLVEDMPRCQKKILISLIISLKNARKNNCQRKDSKCFITYSRLLRRLKIVEDF